MIEWYWIVLISLGLLFCFIVSHRLVYIRGVKRGYEIGVRQVLAQWKATLNEEDDDNVE